MSNDKNAYGWSGHILVSNFDMSSKPAHNVVAVPNAVFRQLADAMGDLQLDERIECKQLGVEDDDAIFLAAGSCFSRGYTFYGTIFEEAETRALPGPPLVDHDAEYLAAMKELYGLTLPPCRLMIGCSAEH
jgi:hypothetical protein